LLLCCLWPLPSPQKGDNITFEWQFYGVGSQSCFHDGELLAKCSSPLTVAAKGFNGTQNHTLDVVFVDVCGNKNAANFTYSTAGVVGLSAVDYVDANDMVTEDVRLLSGAGNGSQLLSVRASQGNGAGWGLVGFGVRVVAAAAFFSMLGALQLL
jgi:hypothetical protein